MSKVTLLPTILDYLVTSLDREVLIEQLQEARSSLFDQKRDLQKHALSNLPYWLTPRLLEEYPDFSRTKIDEELGKLIDALREVQVAQLTITYMPTMQQIWQYLHTCREYFGPSLVLQIKQDPQILGGVVVTFNGQQIDLSLATKLKELHA